MASDMFTLKVIDKVRNKLVSVSLEDQDGGTINIKDVVEEVEKYINNELISKEYTVLLSQTYPLISSIFMASINNSVNSELITASIVSDPSIRLAFIKEMLITFYVLKFIQVNKIKIIEISEDLTEEQMNKQIAVDVVSSYGMQAHLMGSSKEEIISNIIKSNILTKDELIENNIASEKDFKDSDKKNEN